MRIGKGFSRRGRIRNGRNYRADFENHPLFEQHATFPYNFLPLPACLPSLLFSSLLCTQRGLTRGRLANDANYPFELFCLRSDRVLENMRIGFDASITNRSSGILFFFVGDFFFLILDELINIACVHCIWKKEEIKTFYFSCYILLLH